MATVEAAGEPVVIAPLGTRLGVNGQPCAGATLADTDAVSVVGASRITIDLSEDLLLPGFDGAWGPGLEILGRTEGLRVIGSARDDTFGADQECILLTGDPDGRSGFVTVGLIEFFGRGGADLLTDIGGVCDASTNSTMVLRGGRGKDVLNGGYAPSLQYGGRGDDRMTGSNDHADFMRGGPGADDLNGFDYWHGSLAAYDTLDGGAGKDTCAPSMTTVSCETIA